MNQDGDLRLMNDAGDNLRAYSGRLELFFNGQWGTVCSVGFDKSVADRVCQELGYKSALYFGTAADLGLASYIIVILKLTQQFQTIACG